MEGTTMTANVDRVEHAITESLNGLQLHQGNPVSEELYKMQKDDPQNWRDNLKLFEKMTKNYQGFPHLCIDDGSIDRTVRPPLDRSAQMPPDGRMQPSQDGRIQVPQDRRAQLPDDTEYRRTTPVQFFPPQSGSYRDPRDARDPRDYRDPRDNRDPRAMERHQRRQPDLGDQILGGIVRGFGEGVGLGLSGRLMQGLNGGHRHDRSYYEYQRQLEYQREQQRYRPYQRW